MIWRGARPKAGTSISKPSPGCAMVAWLGVVNVPEVVANLCFGEPKRNVLYIYATTSLRATRLFANGHETF